MPAEREYVSGDIAELFELVRVFSDRELLPRVDEYEESERFPREIFEMLGKLGLLSLALPEEYGGSNQPYVVYLQVLEEIAARWSGVALGISVHTLACFPLLKFGSEDQKAMWASSIVGGELLGAYCLSESHAGSDPSAMRATASHTESGWRANGSKAWITHGGQADFYTTFLRTSEDLRRGISCFHVDHKVEGLRSGAPERKMGMRSSTTSMMNFDDVKLKRDALLGEEGQGMQIALSALDTGRLGIAAIAVGIAQAALDYAVLYAQERETFGTAIVNHQGIAFLLADMDAAIESARATYLMAARKRDAGRTYSREASIAKLVATDASMMVTTNAVQILGGAGYVRDHPVERYMREAKVTQIFEGTNQIQRLIIGRNLTSNRSAS